jgi:phage-related baseplate assembly protein
MQEKLNPRSLDSLPSLDLFVDQKTTPKDILEGILEKVKVTFPEYFPQKYDPLYELASSFAYREVLLRKRINDVALNYCIKLEEANREKITPFGFKSYYIQQAKSCFAVKEATAEGLYGGVVQVYILLDWEKFTGKPEEKVKFAEKVKESVLSYLSSDGVKMLSDTIQVSLLKEIPLSIKAKIIPKVETQIILDVLKKDLIASFVQENRPGQSKSLSWFVSKLQTPDVESVEILSPRTFPKLAVGEYLVLENVDILVSRE